MLYWSETCKDVLWINHHAYINYLFSIITDFLLPPNCFKTLKHHPFNLNCLPSPPCHELFALKGLVWHPSSHLQAESFQLTAWWLDWGSVVSVTKNIIEHQKIVNKNRADIDANRYLIMCFYYFLWTLWISDVSLVSVHGSILWNNIFYATLGHLLNSGPLLLF